MAFCKKCGQAIDEQAKFYGSCGAATTPQAKQDPNPNDYAAKLQALGATADRTEEFSSADIQQNKNLAILSYLGILVLIPIFVVKDSSFARYHANQGLTLALTELAFGIIYRILSAIILAISWRLFFLISLLSLIWLLFLGLSIIGILNAANGRAKELPFLGKIRLLK